MKVLLLVVAALSLWGVVNSYPVHASCKLTWTFPMNCSGVYKALVDQIHKWNMSSECGSSEKCLYQITKQTSSTQLEVTHTTPVKHYVDDLTFDFTNTTSTECTVKGFSTSETWYAVLDYGTNYCNLRNLADGAGLTKSSKFKEVTSDSICTQFSSKNCDKY